MDRQTAMVKPVYLHNFVGIFNVEKSLKNDPPGSQNFMGGVTFSRPVVKNLMLKFEPCQLLTLKNDPGSHLYRWKMTRGVIFQRGHYLMLHWYKQGRTEECMNIPKWDHAPGDNERLLFPCNTGPWRGKGGDLTQSFDKSTYFNSHVKKAKWKHKDTTKKFDYNAIADRLRTVGWSNYTVTQLVSLNRFTGPTLQLPTAAV